MCDPSFATENSVETGRIFFMPGTMSLTYNWIDTPRECGADTQNVNSFPRSKQRAQYDILWQYSSTLLRHFRARGIDADDADDLLQLTFVQALQSFHTFRHDATLSTWLHGIARYVALNHFRVARARVKRASRLKNEAEFAILPIARDPYLAARLRQALAQLRPAERRAFLMHFAGFTHAEIARSLNVAIGTSKAMVHRARRDARRWLTLYTSTERAACRAETPR